MADPIRSSAPIRPCLVIPFRRPARQLRDADGNAAWDRLLAESRDAWTWRDPDSIAALEQRVRELKRLVAREWSV